MRRVYKDAASVALDDGYGIVLDGKPLRTPAKRPLAVPSRALAEAIALEWQEQGNKIDLDTMPMTRFASSAIDLVAPRRNEVHAELLSYAGTDLVCYRAEHPAELIQRQHESWQALVDWATLRFDAPLIVTSGILPVPQAPATLRAFGAALEAYDAMLLTALHAVTTSCGSLVIALALLEFRLDADSAFAASELDESFEIEKWGEDSEQAIRRAGLRADIASASRFADLVRG